MKTRKRAKRDNTELFRKMEQSYERDQVATSNDRFRPSRMHNVEIHPVSIQDAIRGAAKRFNFLNADDISMGRTNPLDPHRDPQQLSASQKAITTAHIRHEFTNYDNALLVLADSGKAYDTLKNKYIAAIRTKYPELRLSSQVKPKSIVVPIHVPHDFSVDSLTTEERRTVLAATNEIMTIDDIPIDVLLEEALGEYHSRNRATHDESGPDPRKLAFAMASYAIRRHSNLETLALSYLDRPGFPAAWDLLHASILEAFANRYPRYAHAFRSRRTLVVHDWQQKTATLTWTSPAGEPRSAELRVTRTTLEHLLNTPPSRLPQGYKPTGFLSALETCFQDFTNFNYEIAFPYEADFKADPSLRHELTIKVLEVIAASFPQLQATVTTRIQQLNTSKQAEEAEIRAKQQREVIKSQELAREEQEVEEARTRAKQLEAAAAQITGMERQAAEGKLSQLQHVAASVAKEKKRIRHEELLAEHQRIREEKQRAKEETQRLDTPSFEHLCLQAIELMTVEGQPDEELELKRREIANEVMTLTLKRIASFIGRVTGSYPHGRELYEARKDLPYCETLALEPSAMDWEKEQVLKDYPELQEYIVEHFKRRQTKHQGRVARHVSEGCQSC